MQRGGGGDGTGSHAVQDAKAGELGEALAGAPFTGEGDFADLPGGEDVVFGKQPAQVAVAVGEPCGGGSSALSEGVHHHLTC